MVNKRTLLLLIFSLLCATVSSFLLQNTSHADLRIEVLEGRLSEAIDDIDREAQTILRDPESVRWSSLEHSFFLMDSTEVLAWSNHPVFPDLRSAPASKGFELFRSNSGDYLVKAWGINTSRRLLGVIPLTRKYPVSNRYLSAEWNTLLFQGMQGIILDETGAEGTPVRFRGEILFRFLPEEMNAYGSSASLIMACLSLLLFVIGGYAWIKKLVANRSYGKGFMLLAAGLLLMRVFMLVVNLPANWISSSVFSPQYFASSVYNASVGDLFLNAICVLVLCGYVFFTYPHWFITRYVLRLSGTRKFITGVLCILVAYFSFLYSFVFIEAIFHNSSIVLDITASIHVDWLRGLSMLSVLAGAISTFFFVHVFIHLAKTLLPGTLNFLIALAVSGILFGIYFSAASHDYFITLPVATLFFLILAVTRFTSSLKKPESTTFIYFFSIIAALGFQYGWSIKFFTEEKRAASQIKYASNYLIGRDVLGEYLLNESARRIKQDAFIQSRLNNPFLAKSPIRQKIRQVYLNSYFDRYEAEIYLYSSTGEPLDNNSPENLTAITNRFQRSAVLTDYEGIYFIQASDMGSNKRYLSLIPVSRADILVGFVIIDLSLKRIIPQNVFPELLVDRRFVDFLENTDHSFAFIKDQKIISSSGSFNYERDLDFSVLSKAEFYTTGIRKDGYFHTGVEDVTGQVVVLTSRAYPYFYGLTNFSFFFVSGVLLLVISMLVYGLVSVVKGNKMNYAARIQLYIYLAFSLPLVVATITTLNRITNAAEQDLQRTFETNTRNLGEGILSTVTEYVEGAITREDLENVLMEQSTVANADITFYDRAGKYVASSQPLIVENQIMSPLMNRLVWEKINNEGVNSLTEEEQIGSLRFNNCYVTIKSPDSGALLGMLSVPFFNSASSLENTQVNVLSNFLTVFTIIFILFSILSLYVVNSLTFPLRFITRILSRTTLAGGNKPLEWKSNDEIGMMVSEYNKMVHNLEQSKIELARSQKESAWREIAKQVAHEIKNPLTPMKLTLQQMEYQLKERKLDDEKARTSILTLLTQVDILNEIASSFSAFARMPAPLLQPIDLVTLLQKTVNLYRDYEGGEVSFSSSLPMAYAMGDEQLFNRIFSNIILNGLQSCEGRQAKVQVSLTREGGNFLISIKDNGDGMDPEKSDKVFIPYFSTKQSGSGLGLAISKQGIEQSGGEIWFDTRLQEGTTFYIRLPGVD